MSGSLDDFHLNCSRVSFGAVCLIESNLKNVSNLSENQQDDGSSFFAIFASLKLPKNR